MIGFADDYLKVRRRRSLGLSGRWKMLGLLAVTAVVGYAVHEADYLKEARRRRRSTSPSSTSTSTCTGSSIPFLFVVIAGTANGVNLTDGLDGLAAGTCAISIATLLAIAAISWIRSGPVGERSDNYLDIAIFAAALIGGVIGFLWFNAFPAEVFMGDTGSMALGGAIATLTILTETEVLLDLHRRDLPDRGALRDDPGGELQAHRQARLPDGADPPPFRDEGVVGDEDHGALLDRRRDPGRDRVRALLPLLPPLQALMDEHALVLGLARSGTAAALALRGGGVEVVAHDARPGLDRAALEEAGARVVLGADDPALLDGIGLVVKSPGVPGTAPLVAAARERGIPVISEIELGARLLPNPIIGITGTNGKTTTAALLGRGLRGGGGAGRGGGEHRAPADVARRRRSTTEAWVVCELSSFQLEDVDTLRPRIAVLLNLEPDHIDRHGTLAAYTDAKLRIFENQGPDDVWRSSRAASGRFPGAARRVEVAGDDPLPAEPLIPGAHNRENAAAATAAARAAGIGDDAIAEALRAFRGVEHRIEEIARGRRRPLRERLEGDERRRGAAGARVVPRRAGCT